MQTNNYATEMKILEKRENSKHTKQKIKQRYNRKTHKCSSSFNYNLRKD